MGRYQTYFFLSDVSWQMTVMVYKIITSFSLHIVWCVCYVLYIYTMCEWVVFVCVFFITIYYRLWCFDDGDKNTVLRRLRFLWVGKRFTWLFLHFLYLFDSFALIHHKGCFVCFLIFSSIKCCMVNKIKISNIVLISCHRNNHILTPK